MMKDITLDLFNRKVVLISDIHSNAVALCDVRKYLEKYRIDCVIVLGDLLTYGCHPNEVVNILKSMSQDMTVYFVKGNHEEFYFNISTKQQEFGYKIPDFVRDSIAWTSRNIIANALDSFVWCESISIGPLYISHANPYEYGDWSYINSDAECIDAAHALKTKNYKIGIFGHTHRPKAVIIKHHKVIDATEDVYNYSSSVDEVMVLNTGSVGQPRGAGASFLVFELNDKKINYSLVDIQPELEEHIDAIKSSDLSENSKSKIISFFEESK